MTAHRLSARELNPEEHRGMVTIHHHNNTPVRKQHTNKNTCMHMKFLQTRTKLAAPRLQFLWHDVGPAIVNEAARHTNTHTCTHTHCHIHTSYVRASVPGNKAKRGQWGLMPLQLERLTVSHKVLVLIASLLSKI